MAVHVTVTVSRYWLCTFTRCRQSPLSPHRCSLRRHLAVGSRPRQPEPLSESQFSSLLSAMQESQRRLDRKLAEFKSDVRQAQDEAATKAINRVRREKPYEFKRKAHEEQARFNAQVEESVQEAQDALATMDDSPSLQRAHEALEKGARLLAER